MAQPSARAKAKRAEVLELPTAQRSNGMADPDEVADRATEMPEAYIKCRIFTHRWDDWAVNELDDPTLGHTHEVILKCDRCGATVPVLTSGRSRRPGRRRRGGARRASRVRGSIKYGEGYLQKGLGRIAGEATDALWAEYTSRRTDTAQSATRKSAG